MSTYVVERDPGAVSRALQLPDVVWVVLLQGGQGGVIGRPPCLRLVRWQHVLLQVCERRQEVFDYPPEGAALRRVEGIQSSVVFLGRQVLAWLMY